jgi:transcriptional regulator with XRE-family HTH domain
MASVLSMASIKAFFTGECNHTCAPLSDTGPMSTYGERIEQELSRERPNREKKTRAGLAKALGISVQAVGQVILGKTKAFTAANNSAAAAYLECDESWLATGKKRVRFGWVDPAFPNEVKSPQEFAKVHTVASKAIKKAEASSRDAAPSPEAVTEQFGLLLAAVHKSDRQAAADVLHSWAMQGGADSLRRAFLAVIGGIERSKPAGT